MNPALYDSISLITFMVLCVIVGILEEKIKVARPGLAKPIDVLVNTLMIVIIYLVRNIVLGTLSIVDPTVDSWIVTGLSYGFYIPMLPCVYDILSTLGSTRRMVKLMHDATFLLVAIGAKSPQGYAIFSYQMDHEKGFCKGECAICLMEYETKDKFVRFAVNVSKIVHRKTKNSHRVLEVIQSFPMETRPDGGYGV
ncbi:hypothetical protein ACLB2K_013151 [Fragaria x ananassa]